MFKKKILFSALILMLGLAMLSNEAIAQEQAEANLSGEVVDASTQEAISGAQIMLEGSDMETTSGDDGSFTFDSVEPGSYTITASAEGYEDWEEDITINEDGDSITIELEPNDDY
ncbi:MAG: carboxypeptidase regulatory-like domain-containing protein [Bacteroidota bacterium]